MKNVRVWRKSKDVMRKILLGKAIFTHPNGRMSFSSSQRGDMFQEDHSDDFEMCSLELSNTEDKGQIIPEINREWVGLIP